MALRGGGDRHLSRFAAPPPDETNDKENAFSGSSALVK
jgi:hypothetical protein